MDDLFLIRHLPNGKIDLNSGQFSESGLSPVSHRHGGYFPFSTDLPFLQHGWPLGSPAERKRIFAQHKWWTQALMYYLGNDAELLTWQPALVDEIRGWGLCGDEFKLTSNWPPQLYVRESIRMRGEKVLTQQDVFGSGHGGGPGTGHNPVTRVASSVGTSKWLIDIHAVKRMAVLIDGVWRVANTGGRDTGRSKWGPSKLIEVPYEVFIPQRNDTANLLVPVCVSSTHVGFSAFRLEPQYAVFGHSAGVAAAIAAREKKCVQDVDAVQEVQPILLHQGQIVHG